MRIMRHTPQGCDHSPKSDRAQETFGQLSEAHGVALGAVLCRIRAGFDDHCGSFPTQGVLRFCGSTIQEEACEHV